MEDEFQVLYTYMAKQQENLDLKPGFLNYFVQYDYNLALITSQDTKVSKGHKMQFLVKETGI